MTRGRGPTPATSGDHVRGDAGSVRLHGKTVYWLQTPEYSRPTPGHHPPDEHLWPSDGSRHMRLLLIEDYPPLARSLAQGQEAGHAVDTAADGESGLTLAGKAAYDVIVLDLTFPRHLDRRAADRHYRTGLRWVSPPQDRSGVRDEAHPHPARFRVALGAPA